MKKISAKTAIITLIIVATIGFIVIFALSNKQQKISYKTVEVGLGEIIQTVNETGTVKAITEVKLSFLNNGKIQRQNFNVGDTVKAGQLMAELDYTSLMFTKQEAQANYEVATANLNKLLSGASSEEKKLAEAAVRQAESGLESAKNEMNRIRTSSKEAIIQAEKTFSDLESSSPNNLTTQEQAIISAETNLANAKTTYQQSINNTRDTALVTLSDKITMSNTALDSVNRILTDEDAEDYLSVKNPTYLNNAKSSYSEAMQLKILAQDSLNSARIGLNDNTVSKALSDVIRLLDSTIIALSNTLSALNNSITTTTFSQADIDAHKSTQNAQLNIMNAAIQSVKAAEQNYKNSLTTYNTNIKSSEDALAQAKSAYSNALTAAKNAVSTAKNNSEQQITAAQSRISAAEESLDVAKAQRDKVLAGADANDISLNRARIRQAQASIDSINQQIENSQIKSPIDGQITEINYKVGEQVMPSQAVYSLLGNGEFEIEVLISEADINKVKVGDLAEITLDAFGDDKIFNGSVFFIEPAETIIQDVIYYLVNVKFDQAESNIKPGMTANVTITTNKKSNVFSIPSRAIIDKGAEGNFVKLLVADKEIEQKIIIGLRGDEGNVEIVDGLKVGDLIITQVIEN